MFVITLLLNIASVAVNRGTGLMVPAIISLVASIWAFGIASNFRGDPMNIPSYSAFISIVSAAGGLILLLIGIPLVGADSA